MSSSTPSDAQVANATDAGNAADALIAAEIATQDKMWGVANERTDIQKGQLFGAGLSQLVALHARIVDGDVHSFEVPPVIYPPDWSGFRDYGSDVMNIVVAIAFLRQEIKRKIGNGESTFRKPRDLAAQPYKFDQPLVNAVDAV